MANGDTSLHPAGKRRSCAVIKTEQISKCEQHSTHYMMAIKTQCNFHPELPRHKTIRSYYLKQVKEAHTSEFNMLSKVYNGIVKLEK